MGALRHDSAALHLHADQQPFLGGGERRCWDYGVRPRDGGRRGNDDGFRDSGLVGRVNVCMQARTGIGRFVLVFV